jgi:hypothetical protein
MSQPHVQFSLSRLLLLMPLVAWAFGSVGRFWPVGTAVGVVVCVGAGIAILAFGSVKSWKLVVWVLAVFAGCLIGSRLGLPLHRALATWPLPMGESWSLLAGALVAGVAAALALALPARKPIVNRAATVNNPSRDRQ